MPNGCFSHDINGGEQSSEHITIWPHPIGFAKGTKCLNWIKDFPYLAEYSYFAECFRKKAPGRMWAGLFVTAIESWVGRLVPSRYSLLGKLLAGRRNRREFPSMTAILRSWNLRAAGLVRLRSEDKMGVMEMAGGWQTLPKKDITEPNDEKSAVRSRKVSKVCLFGGGGIRTCAKGTQKVPVLLAEWHIWAAIIISPETPATGKKLLIYDCDGKTWTWPLSRQRGPPSFYTAQFLETEKDAVRRIVVFQLRSKNLWPESVHEETPANFSFALSGHLLALLWDQMVGRSLMDFVGFFAFDLWYILYYFDQFVCVPRVLIEIRGHTVLLAQFHLLLMLVLETMNEHCSREVSNFAKLSVPETIYPERRGGVSGGQPKPRPGKETKPVIILHFSAASATDNVDTGSVLLVSAASSERQLLSST
ncbi:hypothetical protein B0H14DRAFT_2584567 [Mycena olivaceomarginata]|nr:hypothetical protein B0H14DRAFT_2584567 [Mycena olivaceomarginata]